MKLVRLFILLLGVCFCLTGTAFAGPLSPPVLKPGVYVYTIPEGFDPPLIGRSGMVEIQSAIEKLHFPFYAILIQSASLANGNDLSVEIDGLAEDWQRLYPSEFKVTTSQIFLLSYQPRKYQFLGGSKFKSEIGFEKEAMRPYVSIFEGYVRGTPKDPKTGILKMFESADGYLFDQTDPGRIRGRQEQARRDAERKRHDFAFSTLNHQIEQLSDLLRDSKYLPQDANPYRKILVNAREVRDSGNVDEMVRVSQGAMAPTITELGKYVDERQSEETRSLLLQIAKHLLLGALGVFLIGTLLRRKKRFESLKSQLRELIETWDERIANASSRYMGFYHEREWAFGLADATGETAERFKTVTAEVDAIYALVRAMEGRVSQYRETIKAVSFLRFGILEQAIAGIEAVFEFDTGTLNEADLFGKETKRICVDPSTFVSDLNSRFKENHAKWVELKRAAEFQEKVAEDAIPSSVLDELFSRADQFDIPRRWLEEHPLYGDDASDQAFYARMNELRLKDPWTYMGEVLKVHKLERDLSERLDQLVQAVMRIGEKRLERLPDTQSMIVDPSDDPTITYAEAQREEGKFRAYLLSQDDVASIVAQSEKVVSLYGRCLEQQELIRGAIQQAGKAIQRARDLGVSLSEMRSSADGIRIAAERVHAKCMAANFISAGDRYAEDGKRKLEKANRQNSEKRFINARRTAEEGEGAFQSARDSYEKALKHCKSLDDQKREYEEKLASMEVRRGEAIKRVKGYRGSESHVAAFQRPRIDSGLLDYAVLYTALSSQEQSWRNAEVSAQRAYEAQERAKAIAAAEAAAEAARQAEEARRQASYAQSSWSSNDTSSIGGSISIGTSSIGGDW